MHSIEYLLLLVVGMLVLIFKMRREKENKTYLISHVESHKKKLVEKKKKMRKEKVLKKEINLKKWILTWPPAKKKYENFTKNRKIE